MHHHSGHAALTVSPTSSVCPGFVVNFTCTTSSPYMRWTANIGTYSIQQVTFIAGSSSSSEYRILGTNHLFIATIISHTPELTSNLTVIAVAELNGLAVHCNSDSTGNEDAFLHITGNYHNNIDGSQITIRHANNCDVTLLHTEPPTFPSNLHVASIQKRAYYADVILEWNSPLMNNTTEYIVTVLFGSHGWKTNLDYSRTSVTLRIPYNTIHTISVTATNCAGISTPIDMDPINIGQLLMQ